MYIVIRILRAIFLLAGLIVCIRGIKSKNAIYKGGFYFFILTIAGSIYSFVMQRILAKITLNLAERGSDAINFWATMSVVPSSLISLAAIIVLVIFLIIELNKNIDEDSVITTES